MFVAFLMNSAEWLPLQPIRSPFPPLSRPQWPRDAVLARHLLAQAQAKLRNQNTGRRAAVRTRGPDVRVGEARWAGCRLASNLADYTTCELLQ